MRGTRYFQDKNSRQQRQISLRESFWKKVLEVGPWRINTQTLEYILANYSMEEALSKFDSLLYKEDRTLEFLYRHIGSQIFVIWIKEGEKDIPLNVLNYNFYSAIQKINGLVPKEFKINKFTFPEFKLAEYEDIEKNRDELPKHSQTSGFGRCLRSGNPWDVRTDLFDGGKPGSTLSYRFVVAVAELEYADTAPEAGDYAFKPLLLNADHERANLQPLPANILEDNTQGHWDLFWPEGTSAPEEWYEGITTEALEARDPARDIQSAAVAIDFGTSSTVVVLKERGRKKGRITPVRVGVADMSQPVQASHYENPTVLGFENFGDLLAAWQALPYRPNIRWSDTKCSHEARAELQGRIKSGMTGLKSWCKGRTDDPPVLLQDSKGEAIEFQIPSSTPGHDIAADFARQALNPVELYAFYLGLHLNNQLVDNGRIFTEYYMTFPVKFEKRVKEFILASFRRGLIRSLPASLIYASGFDPAKIVVRERVNEAAAYAAAVLDLLENMDNAAPKAPVDQRKLSELFEELYANLPPDAPITSEFEDSGGFWKACGAFLDLYKGLKKVEPNLKEYLSAFRKDPDLKAFLDRLDGIFGSDEQLQEEIDMAAECNERCQELMANPDQRETYLNDPEHYKFTILIQTQTNLIRRLVAAFKILERIWSEAHPQQAQDVLPISATEEGSAFGVFDFGGGTTDFAVGLYRLPTDEEIEENSNWERIVDIIDSSGDPDLGGECLVHLLAFELVRKNQARLLANGPIPFTLPANVHPFAGSEQLFSNSVIARANTHKLIEKLRPLWEGSSLSIDAGQISETFTTVNGEDKADLKLDVDEAELRRILKCRIAQGVNDYFVLVEQALAKARIKPADLHVLLAGNSCKSPLVMECFHEKIAELKQPGNASIPQNIVIHAPLLPDDAEPEKVTLKTGVAIGVLKSLDSEPIGIIMRKAGDEAPFPFTVGRNVRGLLEPKLKRGAAYDGDWINFAPASASGACLFLYTQSTKGDAGTARRGEECFEEELNFGEGHKGKMIVLKPGTPSSVIFALRDDKGEISMEQEIALEKD